LPIPIFFGKLSHGSGELPQAARYTKSFGSKREEAIFHYHYGYCYWQSGKIADARREISMRSRSTIAVINRQSRAFADQNLVLYVSSRF
jgi:hypothetical protein